MTENVINILDDIKKHSPLVHHITNYVTVNDCANIALAIGASPVMAQDINEVADMVSIAKALVINIGTLSASSVEAMIVAVSSLRASPSIGRTLTLSDSSRITLSAVFLPTP